MKPKPSQHQASTSTLISDTMNLTVPQIYDPWDTEIKHKTRTTKAVSNNDCINQILNKLEEEIMSLADKLNKIMGTISQKQRQALKSL